MKTDAEYVALQLHLNKIEALQRENAELKSLLNKTAAEASFVYCAALVEDGVEMPRTGYGDGWNAAMAKIAKILDHQDDEAWVIKEAHDRVEMENTQLRKAVEEVIELMEHALHMPPALGDLERTITRLKSLRGGGK